MPWSNQRPRSPQYGREHQATRAAHLAALRTAGAGICAETHNPGSHCLMRSKIITPDMDLHLCHNRQTGHVIGLGHAACNRAEGARHARRQQTRRRAHTRQPRPRTDTSW